MFKLKISWLSLTLLSTLAISLINFKAFFIAYENFSQDKFLLTVFLFLSYFCLAYIILAILFFRYVLKFFLILFLITSLISFYFLHFYGVLIDPTMIKNAMNTDKKEVLDLLSLKAFLFILLALFLSYLIFKLEIVYPSFKKHIFIRLSSIGLAFVLFLCFFMPFSKTYVPFFRVHSYLKMYNAPFYQIYALIRYYQLELRAKKELEIISNDAFKEDNTSKKILVLVLGETARAANFSLGGYKKNDTNFYTKQINDLVYFNSVSSCGTATAISLPCMFSKSKRKDYQSFEYVENLLDIFEKTGLKITWISNNSGGCQGVCDRLDKQNVFMRSFDYDEALLDDFNTALKNLDKQNIIILHLQGSHGPAYYKRYPDEFKKFKPTCDTNELSKCTSDELINTYDNTILYTDFILKELIERLKSQKDYEVSLLYVSDHGESLGENGIYLHSMPYFMAPDTQTKVPMLFYSSNETLLQTAKKSEFLELSHDNIFSTLLGYFSISSALYEKEYDFLRKDKP